MGEERKKMGVVCQAGGEGLKNKRVTLVLIS